jgi:UDP-perosamine 4-acetyltransferase
VSVEQLVLIGTGGHAKVIIEMFEEGGQFELIGCTSLAGGPSDILGIPVLGDDAVLPRIHASGVRNAFVALGDNRRRWIAMRQIAKAGFQFVNALSPRACISRRAELGVGVAVMPGAVINVLSRIGDGAIVNTGATVDHDCRIESCVHLGPGTNLAGCVSVGEGAFLGVGTRVIPGISIGSWTTVGAGGVVIRDLPSHVTAVGMPAEIMKQDAGEGH